jgi:cytochrome c oxidase assembly factor CtaG
VAVTQAWTVAAASPDLSWTLDPGPLLLAAGLVALYVPRWRTVRRDHGPKEAPIERLLLALTAALLMLIALVSPLDALAEQSLACHMVQHVILLDLVPICVMLSLTKVLLRPLTRRLMAVERAAGPLGHPAFAAVLYVATMWIWHIPALYDAALETPALHAFEHVCFLSAGLLYWWHLLSPIRSRFHRGVMGPIVYMLSTKLAVGLLGIGLTFATHPLYSYYDHRTPILGLTPESDQQLAGAIMALEQTLVMGIALAYLLVRALEQSEREERRRERLEDGLDQASTDDVQGS